MGNMDPRFKQEMKKQMKEDLNDVRFRTFHVVVPGEGEIGRVTAAFTSVHGGYGEGQQYAVGFSFCSGVDLGVFDRVEGEVRAYQRLNSNRAKQVFTRDNGMLKDQLKLLLLKEAARRGVTWMKGVLVEDLK